MVFGFHSRALWVQHIQKGNIYNLYILLYPEDSTVNIDCYENLAHFIIHGFHSVAYPCRTFDVICGFQTCHSIVLNILSSFGEGVI
jgi:hypothetical protein